MNKMTESDYKKEDADVASSTHKKTPTAEAEAEAENQSTPHHQSDTKDEPQGSPVDPEQQQLDNEFAYYIHQVSFRFNLGNYS